MYVAWEPDPEAAAVDAFALDWGNSSSMHFLPSASSVGDYAQYKWTLFQVF